MNAPLKFLSNNSALDCSKKKTKKKPQDLKPMIESTSKTLFNV